MLVLQLLKLVSFGDHGCVGKDEWMSVFTTKVFAAVLLREGGTRGRGTKSQEIMAECWEEEQLHGRD